MRSTVNQARRAPTPVTSILAPRVLGTYEGAADGPTVVVSGALHGNEPAGVWAAQAVLDTLNGQRLPFRGRLIALVGNRRALQLSRRYVKRDLNRQWEHAELANIRRAPLPSLVDEDREQRELLDFIGPLLESAREPVVFLDLHSTSGPGAPFVCMADVIRNRKIAFNLKVPVVLGLEEAIQDSMLGYFTDLGHVGVAIEGGQHDDPRTLDHHQAAVWSVLVACGAMSAAHIPSYHALQDRLQAAVQALPQVIEIRHRHVCVDGDGFVMRPGYSNFQPIRAGEIVAADHKGDVRAPEAGIMMLPRYQGQGEDGYFVARPVRPFWLSMSERLRRMRADRVLRGLPGVTPYPGRPDQFIVDPRIARYRALEVFHLLGFRRMRPEGQRMVFSRRRPDALGPEALPALDGILESAESRATEPRDPRGTAAKTPRFTAGA